MSQPKDAGLLDEREFVVTGTHGPIPTIEQGQGRAVLIVHGGSGDLTAWKQVADRLARRFRVVRYTRPTYRLDPPPRGPVALEREVADTLSVARWIGEPVILVGHSSGAVVALEAVLLDAQPFVALVAYEPPLDVTHSSEGAQACRRARSALDAGSPVEAMRIHLRDLVGMPDAVVEAMLSTTPARDAFVRVAPGQVADNEMIDALPHGLARYSAITLPVLLIGGDQSPGHLQRRSDDLAAALPSPPQRAVLAGQGHIANLQAPEALAAAVTGFALAH